MKRVGHDAIGGNAHGDALRTARAVEGGETVVEYHRLAVASGDDVIGHVGDGGPRGARHAPIPTHPCRRIKYNDPISGDPISGIHRVETMVLSSA